MVNDLPAGGGNVANLFLQCRLKLGTRTVYKFCRCSNDFITQELYLFLAVNAGLRWLNHVTGVYLGQVSLLLIFQQEWDNSDIGPCFPLAGKLCKFYTNSGGQRRQPL